MTDRERVAIWPQSAEPEERRRIVERARRRGFRHFVRTDDDGDAAGPGESWLVAREEGLDRGDGSGVVRLETVATEAGLFALLAAARSGAPLAIEWTGDRVIPLENAVAACGGRFELWVVARRASEVPAALGALEHGANLVLLRVERSEELAALETVLEAPLPLALERAELPLLVVTPSGLGDRVLVDTTSLLRADEGLLVGSAAAFLFLVTSEATGSAFSRPRPFRVNAGAAHSYVLLADGTTRYLAELAAGDAVLVARPGGPPRSVRVGRCKIERRPLVMIVADDRGVPRTLFLQEAETVRLTTTDGAVPTTELRAGQRALGVRLPPARHLGRAIEETIEER